MPELFPTNPNLPPGYKRPGVFFSYKVGDSGSTVPNRRVLLFGYVPSGAPAVLNAPVLGLSQDQVNSLCSGPQYMLARAYAAAKSHLPAGVGAEFWLLPMLAPSGGAKAQHRITFMAAPVAGVLGSNTAARTSVQCRIRFSGKGTTFQISIGDTFAQIATKALAALQLVPDLPVNVSISGGDTIVAEDWHAGEHGNDMPVLVEFSNTEAAVAASPGTVTLSGGPATAAGTFTVKATVKSAQVAYATADTEAVITPKMAAKLNSDSYSVSGAVASPATAVLTLFYRNERPLHRISATCALGGLSAALAAGTLGSGTPTLTSPLATLTADTQSYKCWAPFWTDVTNWSALASHIIGQNETPIEKNQVVFGSLSLSLTDAATLDLAANTTPLLTSSPLFFLLWEQGAAVCAWELGARAAAMVAAEDFQSRNFNDRPLLGNDAMPLPTPHRADRSMPDDENTAIVSLHLAPVHVDEAGNNAMVRSSTTYRALGSTDQKLEKWSSILCIHYFRQDLKAYLGLLFGSKSIKRYGKPRTVNSVSPQGVKTAVYQKMLEWDAADLFDGAEQLRDAVMAGVLVSPTRIDVALPIRTLGDLDQLSTEGIVQ